MNSKVKKNFIYQIFYQIIIVFVPLVTAPYVSRVLGPDNIGIQSYYTSMTNYFIIFAMLGLNTYGNRTIAMVRDDKQVLNRTFSEIFFLHLIISCSIFILSILLIFLIPKNDKLIYILNLISVFSSIFDINWFYYGLEDIKNIVKKNLFVKLISTMIIFIFVKNSNDLWIYCFSLSISQFIGTIILWFGLKKKVKFVAVTIHDMLKHLKPLLILFLPLIAINLYKYMDKLMLYWLSSSTETGFYENAEKIVSIPNNILSAIGLVMLPYCSNLAAKKQVSLLEKQVNITLQILLFLTIPITFGLAAISFKLAPLYFGENFSPCGLLICLLSFTLFPLTISNVIRTQYLMPLKKDKEFIISLFSGAFVNLIINLLLIPYMKGTGAVIGTLFAEFTVCFVQIYYVKQKFEFKKIFSFLIPYIIFGLVMFLSVIFLSFSFNTSIISLLSLIIIGVIIYFVLIFPFLITIHFDWLIMLLENLKMKKICNFLIDLKLKKSLKKFKSKNIKYIFSFNNVHLCLENLLNNEFNSIFEEKFFKYLLTLHNKYDVCFTLVINQLDSFLLIDKKYYLELKNNLSWLKFSFYNYKNLPKKNIDKENNEFKSILFDKDNNLIIYDDEQNLTSINNKNNLKIFSYYNFFDESYNLIYISNLNLIVFTATENLFFDNNTIRYNEIINNVCNFFFILKKDDKKYKGEK